MTSTSRKSSKQESQTATSTTPQSSVIYVPSTGDSIEDWLTSLRQDSLASHTVTQEKGKGQQTSETSGPIPDGALARYDPNTSCWRTSQASFLTDMEELSRENFPNSAMMLSGVLYPLQILEHPTLENGGGALPGWPTPSSYQERGEHDSTELKNGRFIRKSKKTETEFGANLNGAAANWPTPSARDYKGSPGTVRMKNGRYIRVSNTTKTEFGAPLDGVASNWPTPGASEDRAERYSNTTSERHLKEGRQVHLSQVVRMLSTQPQSGHRNHQILVDGSKSSENDQTSPQPLPKRLNANFVEWMMGLPIGWTDLKPVETGSYLRWSQNFLEE